MRVRRSLLATTAVLLAASLSACSGSDADPEPESKDASPGTTAASEDPEPDFLTGQDWVQEPLAAGDLSLVRMIRQPPYKTKYGSASVRAAFTDDLVLFGDTRGNLYELDRETGKQLWHVKMKTSLPGGDTVCDLVVPSPTATTVVLNHGGGDLCGTFTAYDLKNGKVVDDYDSVSAEGEAVGFELGNNSSLWELDGRVYWLDADERLRVIEDDGSSSIVGSTRLILPGDTEFSVSFLQLIPGTDVFMARYRQPSDGDLTTTIPGDRDGGLFGFRIDEEGGLELVWRRTMRELTGEESSPRHRGDDGIYLQDDVPGTVQDGATRSGKKMYRVRGVDPETGDLMNPGIESPYDGMHPGGPGLPALAEQYGSSYVLSAGESTLFSPYEVPERNGDSSLVRYDLTTGEKTWQWQVPKAMKAASPASMDVLSITPDRSSIYVYMSIDYDNRIWEIDYETGQPRGHWDLPSSKRPYRYDMDFAETYLDGGDVLQINGAGYPDDHVMAALLRTGA